MILCFADGRQIRGDLIQFAALRSDLAPIPLTLEADILAGDEDMDARLAQDQVLTVSGGDALRIIKSVRVAERQSQGTRERAAYRITAVLDACHPAAFVRARAIAKERATLAAIYKAAGASLKAIAADFPVLRFNCPIGDTPTFHIARALQDAGGAVRWKAGRMQFMRLPDMFRQTPVMTLPDSASEHIDSGFMERHTVPWFFSLDDTGAAVFGNRGKSRAARYVPFADTQRLRNMTRCLVRRKTVRLGFSGQLCAGDLIAFTGGTRLAVITAAHVFESGSDTGASNTYTKLWLGSLEEGG